MSKSKRASLLEEALNAIPQFKTNEEALESFIKEYESLGKEYGMTGNEFWQISESSKNWTEDQSKIRTLARSIQMCRYLIDKKANGDE